MNKVNYLDSPFLLSHSVLYLHKNGLFFIGIKVMQKNQNKLAVASLEGMWKKLPKNLRSPLSELKNLCYEFNDYLDSERGVAVCQELYQLRFENMQKALRLISKNNYKTDIVSKFICDYYNTNPKWDYTQIGACHEFLGNIPGDEIKQAKLLKLAAKYYELAIHLTDKPIVQESLKNLIITASQNAARYYEFAAEGYDDDSNNLLAASAAAAECYDLINVFK